MSDKVNISCGGGSGMTLFIVFLILKLTGVITWSWWWVTCPLWIGLAILAVILGGGLIITLVIAAIATVGAAIISMFGNRR